MINFELGTCKNGDDAWAKLHDAETGYIYELYAYRMNDAHNNMYPNNATGYKYWWSVDRSTWEHGMETNCCVIADGYTMTLEEAMQAMETAYNDRDRLNREWDNW